MSNLKAALGWFDLGMGVFGCYEVDTWVGQKLHTKKSPRTRRGFYDAFTTRDEVAAYWRDNPKHLVGVWCRDLLVVADVDKDEESGVDGQFELDENGIVVPETFSVVTPRGGAHYFYKKPPDLAIGPDADISLPNGTILRGVDRRAGNSYFIAWTEKFPPSIDSLAIAPNWLLVESHRAEYAEFSGTERAWFGELQNGKPDDRVDGAMRRIPPNEFGHDIMRDRQLELVRLGAEGHPGVLDALFALRSRWLTPPWDEPEWESDWNACMSGAIRKYGAFKEKGSTSSEDSDFENDVDKELRTLKVRMEANSRLEAEGFRGTELLTFDDLKNSPQDFLVDTLVPRENGIVVLLSKRNLGKTFAYIDMVLSMVFGMPWMGKKTQQAKTLIVLGEGQHGFHDRLKAWCDFHEKPISEVEKWVTFVSGANLNNRTSLEKLRALVSEQRINFCILDTWAATAGLPDEDKAAMVSKTLNQLQDAMGDTTVLITHHPSKATEDKKKLTARGSGAFEGRADVIMVLQPDSVYHSKAGAKEKWMLVSTEEERGGKNRGAAQQTIQGAYLKSIHGSRVWAQDPSTLVRKGTAQVLEHLVGPSTVTEFAARTGVSEATARRCLNDAVADGVLVKEKPRPPSKAISYSFTTGELMRRAGNSL